MRLLEPLCLLKRARPLLRSFSGSNPRLFVSKRRIQISETQLVTVIAVAHSKGGCSLRSWGGVQVSCKFTARTSHKSYVIPFTPAQFGDASGVFSHLPSPIAHDVFDVGCFHVINHSQQNNSCCTTLSNRIQLPALWITKGLSETSL